VWEVEGVREHAAGDVCARAHQQQWKPSAGRHGVPGGGEAKGSTWSVLVSGLRSSNPGNHRQELQRAGRWLHSSCTDKSTRRILQ
jgi:hypothetical protein